MFNLFRVFVQDQSDYDNDEDDWVSFDSVYVSADLGPADAGLSRVQDQERIDRSELQKIATNKIFQATVQKNVDNATLRALLLLQQQELIVATDIELYEYQDTQDKDAAILVSSIAFKSKITSHSLDSSGDHDFGFLIVGGVDVGNARGMAEEGAQVGPSPSSAEERGHLMAAFTESPASTSARPTQKMSSVRTRFWIEAGLATLSGLLGVLTFFTREWIEALTGFDPDMHNGSFEWAIVIALFLACLVLSIAARADWRRINAFAHAGS
jgi:hypothetical protein